MSSNKVRLYVNKKPRSMIRAVVERNGTRAIDTGVFTVPHSVPFTKGDDVAYLQDPVNTTYLVGIWNFFSNTRDESGYELDGDEGADETDATYGTGADGTTLSLFSATKGVKIANDSHINFDGKFDIIIWCVSAGSGSTGGIFSKGDSNNKIQIDLLAPVSNVVRVKATIIKGGTTKTFGYGGDYASGTHIDVATTINKDSEGWHFIRLKRDDTGKITLSVDGSTEGETPSNAPIVGDIATGNTYLYIGADFAGSNIPRSYIAQVRLYSGGHLTDEDFTTLRQTRRQPNTIKFGGTVWKVDEQPTHKVVHCKGYAKILHDIEVESDDSDADWTTNDNDIYKNRYKDKDGLEILQDLMKVYTGTGTDSILAVEDPAGAQGNISGATKEYKEYTALGSLYTNIVLLVMNGTNDSSFSIDGRKILRMEDEDIDHSSSTDNTFSPILFKNGVIRITDLGYDDTTVCTQLTAKTRSQVREAIVVKVANQFEDYNSTQLKMKLGTDTPASNSVVRITVVQNDGGTPTLTNVTSNFVTNDTEPANNTEFKVVQEGGYTHAIFGAAFEHLSDVFTATYTYEPVNDGNYYYTARADSTTLADLGKITKAIYIPQFTTATGGQVSLTQWTASYIRRFKNLNRRYRIRTPTLVNHIRENYLVKIRDDFHGQTSEANVMVKSVKYFYPEGVTEINCGEHFLDIFDIDNAFGAALSELRSTITGNIPS